MLPSIAVNKAENKDPSIVEPIELSNVRRRINSPSAVYAKSRTSLAY